MAPRLAPYTFTVSSPCPDALSLAELHLPGQPIILLASVYAQPPRLQGLERTLDTLFKKYPFYVLIGDFNAQLSLLDSNGVTRNSWSWLTALVHDRHLAVDTYRVKHPCTSAFTWYESALFPCDTRINLFLISPPLASRASFELKEADICQQESSSDHHPIIDSFKLPSTPECLPPPQTIYPLQTLHSSRRVPLLLQINVPRRVGLQLPSSGSSSPFCRPRYGALQADFAGLPQCQAPSLQT